MDFLDTISWRLLCDNELSPYFRESSILILGNSEDERDGVILGKLNENTSIVNINFDVDSSILDIKFNGSEEYNIEHDNDPVSHADNLVTFLISCNKQIIIDITSFSTETLFILLNAFYENNYDKILVIYVEPIEYKLNRDRTFPNFHLSEGRLGISSIPGFLRLTDYEKESKLLVFLGFEGGRFQELCEHLLTEGTVDINPILPLPSYMAGWHMQGLYHNLETLKTNEVMSQVKRVTAWDPFLAYKVLEEQYNQFSDDHQLMVAPLGTKPHTLAVVLFAIKYEDVQIMYDHPTKTKHRSSGIGKVRGYMLEGFLDIS
ncbi:hypothetical protein BGM25_08275 [Bacillus sp. FJAT-29953]|nr:hypothetical protein [Bacillus sp. FJAT-29953]